MEEIILAVLEVFGNVVEGIFGDKIKKIPKKRKRIILTVSFVIFALLIAGSIVALASFFKSNGI